MPTAYFSAALFHGLRSGYLTLRAILLPLISREHIEKPSDVLSIGQEIDAVVVDMNEADKKISLSMKALAANDAKEETTEE